MAKLRSFVTARPMLSAIIVLVLGLGTYLLLNAVIVTDEERIEDVIKRGEKALLAGDAAGVMAVVDRDFATDYYAYEDLKQHVTRYLQDYDIKMIHMRRQNIDIQGQTAQVHLAGAARVTWRQHEVDSGGTFEYNLTFRKRRDGWKLKSLQGTDL